MLGAITQGHTGGQHATCGNYPTAQERERKMSDLQSADRASQCSWLKNRP